jgi:hypothetical protein
MVVKQLIEPDLDPIFLADSYGYRPRKSAHDAIGVTRKRCWKYDWVLEFDIKGLFDNIDHELLLRAVRRHVTCKWALLYIERWLTAPMEHADGLKASPGYRLPREGCFYMAMTQNGHRSLTLIRFQQFQRRLVPNASFADQCRYVHCRAGVGIGSAEADRTAAAQRLPDRAAAARLCRYRICRAA